MSTKCWILKCKQCRAACVYSEIAAEGTSDYFLPKKPDIRPTFIHKCSNCGHIDSYERRDLVYQDDAIAPSHATAKCADEQAKSKAQSA
jgi:hypothetical protein